MAAPSSPCCVECGAPVPSIVQRLGADSVRLARCESCGHVADKYAEFEPTLIVIDLLLYRPSAYRHVLINRQVLRGREEHEALAPRRRAAALRRVFDALAPRRRRRSRARRGRRATGAPPELEASSVAFAARSSRSRSPSCSDFARPRPPPRARSSARARARAGASCWRRWCLELWALARAARHDLGVPARLLPRGRALRAAVQRHRDQGAASVLDAAGGGDRRGRRRGKGLSQLAVVAAWYAFHQTSQGI